MVGRIHRWVALLSTSMLAPAWAGPATEDVTRLLEQTTFGASDAAITQVKAGNLAGYIDQQLAMPATGYGPFEIVDADANTGCPKGTPQTCRRDNYNLFRLQNQFYRNAVNGRDQLRQRVAFALSQIFVTSGEEINPLYAMAAYEQMLLDDAFGSYRQLLEDVTLSPVMGRYLDMGNNDRADPKHPVAPNENYAREILQLFSIGLAKLNPNGTPRLDALGNKIPTYDQATVEGFSRVFTGWTFPTKPGETRRWPNKLYFVGDMEAVPEHHDTSAKPLLDGLTLPAGQSQADDLRAALDNIANHPNVGPFIGKQLIQHLVTSNPSPGYVARISAVFNDDGHRQRGNLGAVVRAILLDPEARGTAKTNDDYGKLREPALLLAGTFRALGGNTDGLYPHVVSEASSEDIYHSPSVFSYYAPDYPLQDTALIGPSFGIFDAATSFARINFLNRILIKPVPAEPGVPGASGSQVDLSSWQALAGNPADLMDRINRVFFHGALPGTARNVILATVNAIPADDVQTRARAALYLALSSAQYQVEQ